MLNPVGMNAVAQARRNDMLKQAEAYRRANQVKRSQRRPSDGLLNGLTGLLAQAKAGAQLKDRQTKTERKATV